MPARATVRRGVSLVRTAMVLLTFVTSSPAFADGSDLLLATTPPPAGFKKTWDCAFQYEGTADSPFDGDDATYCAVDNGYPHNVTVDYGFLPEPSNRFTIRSFRIKVDHTSPRAFLTSLRVHCGGNESGQVGRAVAWEAPASLLNVGALDTGYRDFNTPCEISNESRSYGGISFSWKSSFAEAPFCCTGLRIYSFEAYAEARAPRAPGLLGSCPAWRPGAPVRRVVPSHP